MGSNKQHLEQAKINKNDEFYTTYDDVVNELTAYVSFDKDVFKNKHILCPCNDTKDKAFFQVFKDYFKEWQIKKVTCVTYEKYKTGTQITITNNNITETELKGGVLECANGDFRSTIVTKLRDEADIIITNPPFTIFNEFFNWLYNSNKKFIIVGTILKAVNFVVFPHIWNNKVWLGKNELNKFNTKNGIKEVNCCWFSNLPYKRDKSLNLLPLCDIKQKYAKNEKFKNEYIRYLNYNAININSLKYIPNDYKGEMGVPVTYLFYHDPERFEIIGLLTKSTPFLKNLNFAPSLFVNDYDNFYKNKNKLEKTYDGGVLYQKDGTPIAVFKRIIIKLK